MTHPYLVQRLDTLKAALESQRAIGMTWREIAADYPGVPPGTLCAISKGRVPAKLSVLKALGLMGPAPWLRPAVAWLRERERVTHAD